MGHSPQEALIIGIGLVSLAAFLLAGVCRLLRVDKAWGALLVPAVFLASYYIVYNKIPPFPPVGAVNKIFYIALVGAIFGLVADIADKSRLTSLLLASQPVVAALYIGATRLREGSFEVLGAAAAGLAAMMILRRGMGASDGEDAMRRALVVSIFSLGFAPIALLGASSSSLQLCLIFGFAVLVTLIWNMGNDDCAFGASSFLGGFGGIISVVYAVALITRKTDVVALATLGLIFFVPALFSRLTWVNALKSKAARLLAFALLCAIPAIGAVTVAILSYDSSFPI